MALSLSHRYSPCIVAAAGGSFDAVVIGAGPNGLAAAVAMAREGASVCVLEGADTIGGGTRSAELTLPGFLHDHCAGAHPMGGLSPFFRQLPLEKHGLEWVRPAASVAHPLDDGPAVMLWKSLEETADQFGRDAGRYRSIMRLFLRDPHALLNDVLSSPRLPARPLTMAAFGALAGWPATWFAKGAFRETETRALFAGCAAHSILPLDRFATSALGLLFSLTAHVEAWPMARGGSVAITNSLASYLEELGGTIHTGVTVTSLGDLPDARVALFDTDPHQLARIAGPVLPDRYLQRLGRYRFGPGVFKMDWALDGPIPWKDPRCLDASTVHLGGTLEELAAGEAAMWRGEHPDRPFVLVVQQSMFDSSRAPEGKHTGYAYCHVPHGSTVDLTDVIESQMERFAPGFRDLVLARRTLNTEDFERDNPNCVGGAITGGAADLRQLFARPVARLDPYSTPNERIFICSASTPPGGGVHGMCGFNAARSALRRLERRPLAPFV